MLYPEGSARRAAPPTSLKVVISTGASRRLFNRVRFERTRRLAEWRNLSSLPAACTLARPAFAFACVGASLQLVLSCEGHAPSLGGHGFSHDKPPRPPNHPLCHPERSEGSASEFRVSLTSSVGRARLSVVPQSARRHPLCHPERSEGSAFSSSRRPWSAALQRRFRGCTKPTHRSRSRSTAAPYLTQPPAKTRRGARRAVPLFHFRPSTVDCRLAHAYRASGFSGLNTPCGLSFQIHACTSHGVLAKKWPPFALQSASLRPCGFSRPASMQTLPC